MLVFEKIILPLHLQSDDCRHIKESVSLFPPNESGQFTGIGTRDNALPMVRLYMYITISDSHRCGSFYLNHAVAVQSLLGVKSNRLAPTFYVS